MPQFTVKQCKKCPAYEHITLEKIINKNMGHCNKLNQLVLWDVIDELCPFLPDNEGTQRNTMRRP